MKEKIPAIPAAERSVGQEGNNRLRMILGSVLLITFLSLSPALLNSISTWDDEVHLLKNKNVLTLSLESLPQIFRTDVCKTYIPLTILSFSLEHKLFGFAPFVYHFDNLLLHLAVTALVFCFARKLKLSPWAAGLAALIFGIHPMHVESVAWATERKDVLYSFFYLLALNCYWSYREQRKMRDYFFALGWGLLSILAKAMALSLPFVFWVCDWYAGRPGKRRWVWLDKIPFFLYIIPMAWLTYSLNARMPGQGLSQSLLTWVWTFVFYIQKFFLPFVLLPLYSLPKPVAISNSNYLLAVIIFIGIGAVIYRLRRERLFIFAVLYYFASIFFLLRYDDVVDVNIVADRFMYLPSLGFCLALGAYAERGYSQVKNSLWSKRLWQAAGVGIILFFGMKSFCQAQVWRDDYTMWSHVLKHNTESDQAHFGVGQAYFERGQVKAALVHYQETLRLNPQHAKAHNNVGDILFTQGRRAEAREHFKRAVEIKPDYAEAQNNYGVALLEIGDRGVARQHIKRALELEPETLIYAISIGDLDYADGQYEAAKERYRAVAARDPRNAKVLNRLGAIALQEERWSDAIAYFQQALQIEPNYESAKHNLSVALTKKYRHGQ